MKMLKIGLAMALALLVAACPGSPDAEVARDTAAVAPHQDPGAVPEAAQTVELAPQGGETVAAEARIVPVGVQSQVTVQVRQAPPNTSLTAHVVTGTCEQAGPTAADLQPLVTDANGVGSSQIVVDLGSEVLLNGNHAVQIRRGNGRDGIVAACGAIPAHPVLHGGG
jgi:hypothetical protein